MSDAKPPGPNADDLAKQLKSKLAQRRPRPLKPVLATLAISTLLLALVAWWLYPRAHAPLLQVLALDAIFTPDEQPHARAQLFAPPADEERRGLQGYAVVFSALTKPGEKPREVAINSDGRGQASVAWSVAPAPATAEFLAQHVNLAQREGSLKDLGRLFLWPAEAPLLLVDADETLSTRAPDPEARATLTKAAADGWRIVYLSLTATKADDFRTARIGIAQQAAWPPGPVLGRPFYPHEESVEQARREVLTGLKGRFKGSLLAVVKTTRAAQTSKEIGLKTIQLGDEPAPAEVVRVPSWADVPTRWK